MPWDSIPLGYIWMEYILRFIFWSAARLNCGEYICGIFWFYPHTASKKVIETNFNIFCAYMELTICKLYHFFVKLNFPLKKHYTSSLSNLLWQVAQMQQMFKFPKKCQDKLPSGQSDEKTCILTFQLCSWKVAPFRVGFICTISVQNSEWNVCALRIKCISTKKSLWNFPTEITLRSQKLSHNLCKEQFMHQIRCIKEIFFIWGNQISCCWKL